MLKINFKKFFTAIWNFIKGLFTKPTPPPTPPVFIEVKICELCNKLAVGGCAISRVIKVTYVKGDEPTEQCTPSICCKILPPPPPPIPIKSKLIPEKQYKNAGKLVCPVLMPEFGITNATADEDAKAFTDKFAREGWGNFMRLFVAGNWEAFYQKENVISMPYCKVGVPSRFHLGRTNPHHFERLFRRAGYLADRFIMPMFTLLDNCSIKRSPHNAFWGTHWMNGDNNVNCTSDEAYSQTHWYEYDGESEYHHAGDVREGMKETGDYLMDLYGHVLDEAKRYFGDFFLIEIGNEIDAGSNYHKLIRKFINGRLNQENLDGRVFTSIKHPHFYEKKEIYNHCIPVLHGCGNFGEYILKQELARGKHGASQDGKEPMFTVNDTKANVLGILRSESVMYEGNLRPLFILNELSHGQLSWTNLIRAGRYKEIDWSLTTLPFDLCRSFGTAFSLYLGE